MSDEIEVFLHKVDAFARGLTPTEQAMLCELIRDDAEHGEVSGFSFEAWPASLQDLAPIKLGALRADFDTVRHPDQFNGIAKTGGGNSI